MTIYGHDLERGGRSGEQVLHRAAFALARDREPGHHDHRHRQDHSQEPRHDVVLRDLLRVVARMDAHLEGAGCGEERRRRGRRSQRRQRPVEIAREGRVGELVYRGDRVAGRDWIGRVGFDQQRRTFSAHQALRKIRRNGHHELRLAGREHAVRIRLVTCLADECEIIGVLEGRENVTRKLTVVGDERGSRQMLRIGVDGEAEQDELDDRNADDHAEGQPVAFELDELLAYDAEPARDREPVAH